MNSEPYTLNDYLRAAGVPKPAPFASKLVMPWQPRHDQVVGLNRMLANNRFGLFDDPGCVSADTEFLHPTGWKRIDQWDREQVAQFDLELGVVSFTDPLRYVKEPCSEMLHLKTARGLDQMLSSDHRVLSFSTTNGKRDGKRATDPRFDTAQWWYDNQGKNHGRKLPTAFVLEGGQPADICTGDLRLMVAVIADGHMPNRNSTCYLRLKKQRKIDRIRQHLEGLGYPYRDVPCQPEGFRRISFTSPMREKFFGEFWWTLNTRQLEIVVDECRFWDGSQDARGNGSFSFHSRTKGDADFIQYAASATGRTATLYTTQREGGIDYTVRVQPRSQYVSGKPDRKWITKVPNPEGFKYCFQVPSGALVLRRNGKVFVTGNCGKTVQMQAMAMQLIADGNHVMMLMPPVLLGQFVESMVETFDGAQDCISWHVLNNGPKERAYLYDLWETTGEYPQLLLMSYEMFVQETRVPKGGKGKPRMAHILRERYRVVTTDEGHKLCGHDTLLHGQLSWHCGEPDESMLQIATGTPMPTNPLSAYGIIQLLNPTAYSNFGQFERKHAEYSRIKLSQPKKLRGGRDQEYVIKLSGFKRQDEIRQALYKYGRRVVKENVLNLKEPQIIETPVVLGTEHMRLYKQLEKERILEWKGEIIAGGLNEQRLRQALLRIVTNPEAFLPDGKKIYNAVLDTILELIDSHGNGLPDETGFPNKIIIFCNLRATAAWLSKVLAGFNPVVLNGDTPDKDRARKQFTENDACRILIANPESAGYGLNFQHVSRMCIFAEPTSVPGEFKQAMERIYRNGQEGFVQVYILRASGTIAPRATKEMLNRAHEINKVNRDSVIFSTFFKRAA